MTAVCLAIESFCQRADDVDEYDATNINESDTLDFGDPNMQSKEEIKQVNIESLRAKISSGIKLEVFYKNFQIQGFVLSCDSKFSSLLLTPRNQSTFLFKKSRKIKMKGISNVCPLTKIEPGFLPDYVRVHINKAGLKSRAMAISYQKKCKYIIFQSAEQCSEFFLEFQFMMSENYWHKGTRK